MVRISSDSCCGVRHSFRFMATESLVRLDITSCRVVDHDLQRRLLASAPRTREYRSGVVYVASRYFQKLGIWAWFLPTVILAYRLLTFINPNASVFATDSWWRFSYYFVIEQSMPNLYDFRGSDPVRVAAQMTVVVPFYSGIAYSVGALIEKRKVMERIVRDVLTEPEPEMFGAP